MRFLLIRKADRNTEAGVMPGEELLAAMGAYNEKLMRDGVMLDGMGLQPSSKGARVNHKDGESTVVDGPFAEAEQLIAGFTLIQVGSKEEAIEIARRWPKEDGDVEIEVRQVFELDDFGESEAVDRMRDVSAGAEPRG